MINLLSAYEKNAVRKEYHLRVFTVCTAALSLVLTVLVVSFLPTYLFILSRYQSFLLESQSDETQSRVLQVREKETLIKETNKKIDSLQNSAAFLSVKNVFSEILQNKTPGLAITGFSYDSGAVVSRKGKEEAASSPRLNIVGKSSDRAVLLAFKDALAQKKEFKTVDLPISSLVKDTDLDFSISVTIATNLSEKIK